MSAESELPEPFDFDPQPFDVELALELSSFVHEQCKDVPHDIGIKLAKIVARRYPPITKSL